MLAVTVLASAATSWAEADKPSAAQAAGSSVPATPASNQAPAPAAPQAASSAPATELAAESALIKSVKIKGNRRIEIPAIMQAVRVQPGDQLDRDKVDADVRAVYKLGYFRDVTAQVETVPGGLALEYVVQEKPIVRDIKVEGAKELSVDKVKGALEIKPNAIYSYKELQKSVKKVKKLYTDEGYYLADVEITTTKRSDTELDVLVKIKEGEKVLIQQIVFDGNHAFADRKLKKTMETGEKWWLSWLTGAGTYKEEVLKNDQALIADLYMNNGYINVKVGEPKVELMPDKKGLKVFIGITEGDQYKIGTLGVKGELLESADQLMKKLKEKSGEIFSRSALRNDVIALTDFYADKGYAFANASPLTSVHPDTKTMDITFDMEKGHLVHIDHVNIAGNTKTRDKVVRREIRVDEGELYSATGLKRSKQNLMNTGYFEEANLVTAKGSAPDKLDINVDVKEKPTGTFSVGAGYSSLDGVIGQGSVQQANWLGLGLKATASVAFGSKSKTYNLGLTDPYFLDSKWNVGADVYRNERQYVDYTRRATGGDIKAGYPISDNMGTFWIYKYEEKEILDESQALLESIHAGSVLPPDTHTTTSSITASINRNTTDYRIDPSSGMMDSLSVEFAGIGGTNHFIRYITDHTLFMPTGWSTVASVRASLGYIQTYTSKEVPIDEKFYLGGINSLRGYASRTVCTTRQVTAVSLTDGLGVGTTGQDFVYLGGNVEAVANLEWTFPLLKEAGLKAVVFFDAGNSQDTFKDTFSKVLTSYGAGVRWFSPIGPLRLEYGIPINPRSGIDSASGKLEFSIGTMF
ncbi:outer membrane protein assembly factor BamA [Geomonas sp. Red32]|uniref:outer membrane protein assembly factor BamA n=1 Tax=Geomonas sp. Red32 TaxID=2912856 RepID=UPI00202CC31A|nr:outer membrane protein assembly factor BamA [Geomonas sp. Red32]MCM0082820.1 outer membrane protein assembly factor BamA [Geomonas sp. Red32]